MRDARRRLRVYARSLAATPPGTPASPCAASAGRSSGPASSTSRWKSAAGFDLPERASGVGAGAHPVQWTEAAGKLFVVRKAASHRLGH